MWGVPAPVFAGKEVSRVEDKKRKKVTLWEAAEYLDLTPGDVQDMIERGVLEADKFAGAIHIPREEVERRDGERAGQHGPPRVVEAGRGLHHRRQPARAAVRHRPGAPRRPAQLRGHRGPVGVDVGERGHRELGAPGPRTPPHTQHVVDDSAPTRAPGAAARGGHGARARSW